MVEAAGGSNLSIRGGMFIRMYLDPDRNGRVRESQQMVYIANCTSQYFICKAALMELGLLDRSFPMPQMMPQRCEDRAQKPKSSGEVLYQEERQCKCPARCIPPEPPTELPMPATVENIPKLKKWIEEKYASSAFNVCTH